MDNTQADVRVTFSWDGAKFAKSMRQVMASPERFTLPPGVRAVFVDEAAEVLAGLRTMRVMAAFSAGAWRRAPRP